MEVGDHVKVNRGLYAHHGIVVEVEPGVVVHYSGELASKSNAVVRRDLITEFAAGGEVEVVEYARCDLVRVTLERAQSRLGEALYAITVNNCEHFARWCKTGKETSEQVNDAAAAVGAAGGTGAAVAGSLGVVSAAGAAAGLSGAGVMSGLATVGGTVGLGAVGGIGMLAAAPATITTFAMRHVLKDDSSLPDGERQARAMGRNATVAGGAAGIAGSIAAVSASGAVVGLSGAGITSGLATIGAVVGGGMASGVAVAVAAPAAAAAAVGYGAYRLWRWIF